MNLAVRDQASRSAPASAERRDHRQTSQLLPLIFEQLDTRRKITVLEVGRAMPETVAFFSQYRCRLHVLDLYGELESGHLDRAGTGKTLQRQFQELFGFEPGTQLDLCLLWDLPHYLEEKQLRAFSAALWPWLQPHSRAHIFGVHSAATQLLNREYGIVNIDSLSVRPRETDQLKHSPHPQSFLSEWLTCFSTSRGVLLGDGKIESIMSARL